MDPKDFKSLIQNITIDNVITTINQVEENQGLGVADSMVKWKSYEHQVVIESENYFYKVYEATNGSTSMFDHLVRVAYAEVLEELGIKWDLVSVKRGEIVFDFEQRQKLEVVSLQNCDFAEILLSMSYLYDKIEDLLEFDKILNQLQNYEEFSGVKKLKLSRICLNKEDDYALLHGQAILLDDADFYIALVDENDDVMEVSFGGEIPIETSYGASFFCKYDSFDRTEDPNDKSLNGLTSLHHGWILQSHVDDDLNRDFDSIQTSDPNDLAKKNRGDCGVLVQAVDKEVIDAVNSSVVSLERAEFGTRPQSRVCDESSQNKTVIKSRLTDPVEEKVYDELDLIDQHGERGILITELNPEGDMLKSQDFKIWVSHVRTILEYYSSVDILTVIYLSGAFCENFLSGNFDPYSLCGKYNNPRNFRFEPPSETRNYPKRKLFRKFLVTFARNYPELLHLIFFKDDLVDGEVSNHNKSDERSGGARVSSESDRFCEFHNTDKYCCYFDCSDCMLCDFEQINVRLQA